MTNALNDYHQWLYSQLQAGALLGPAVSEAIAIGLLSDCLVMAKVEGRDAGYLTPDVMDTLAEELIKDGDSIWKVGAGELEWIGSYSITNGKYMVDGRRSTANIFHVRYRVDRRTGRGRPPLATAPVFHSLALNMDKRMEEEANIAAAQVIPIAQTNRMRTEQSEEQEREHLKELTARMRKMAGKIYTLASQRQLNDASPTNEYEPVRWGPKFDEANLSASEQVRRLTLAMLGVPQEVVDGGGAGLKESLRFYLHTTLPPYGRRIEAAAAKALLDIEIDFGPVLTADLIAMGRVFNNFVDPADKLASDEAMDVIGMKGYLEEED